MHLNNQVFFIYFYQVTAFFYAAILLLWLINSFVHVKFP